MAGVEIKTENHLLKAMRPGDESEEWQRWLADPFLMASINAKPANRSLRDLREYLAMMMIQKRVVVGIRHIATGKLRGIIEMKYDPRHRSVSLTHLLSLPKPQYLEVLSEVEQAFLKAVAVRFKVGKFSTVVPSTYIQLIDVLPAVGWNLEGILRNEFPNVSGTGRIDAHVFGTIFAT